MKLLINSEEFVEGIRNIVSDLEIIVLSDKNLKDIKKTRSSIDCILLSYKITAKDDPMDTLPLLRRLAVDVPEIPVFVLDSKFALSHHNKVTDFPNVIAYGQIGHSVTDKELTALFNKISNREVINQKLASISSDNIKQLGWSIKINNETDFIDDYADKLFLGEMRIFINNLKRIIDKIRPGNFTPDYTAEKPLPAWLEMWHAHKQGATHYTDPNTGLQMPINKNDIEEAKKLFETKKTNSKAQHILIRGESGSGKTFIAHFIHSYYYRGCKKDFHKKNPTIVSSPELQGNLATAILFGSISGAWTDSKTRMGYLLESYNGTLFLDEIGDASSGIQAKLLRYLDYQNFKPDGWDKEEIYVPLLVVAATNRDIKQMIKDQTFREDLYNRFFEIEIPPLRSCKEYFEIYIDCELQNPRTNNGFIDSITTEAIEILTNYDYPGNFREFHRILGLSVEEAKSTRVKTIMKEHVESAMNHIAKK